MILFQTEFFMDFKEVNNNLSPYGPTVQLVQGSGKKGLANYSTLILPNSSLCHKAVTAPQRSHPLR